MAEVLKVESFADARERIGEMCDRLLNTRQIEPQTLRECMTLVLQVTARLADLESRSGLGEAMIRTDEGPRPAASGQRRER